MIIGGIEASLRRLSHYDYWQDKLLPGILIASKADFLVYGCGEKPLTAIVSALQSGDGWLPITAIPQTVFLQESYEKMPSDIVLHSYESCLKDKRRQAENFRHIEEESNRMKAGRLIQKTGDSWIIVNPPYPPMTTAEIDACYDLPYTRMPHPKYKNKRIPAYEMIRHSVTLHRGCFGGCAFCTISAHQGKFIASRSKESVLKEAKSIVKMPDFKGYISDLGGPSANMYQMKGINPKICEACSKPSCIFPRICRNLHADHRPLLELYQAVDKIPEIKKSFVGSGVRYDLLVHRYEDDTLNKAANDYMHDLIRNHVSGRLKVAPEHTSRTTLDCIRKPDFSVFYQFKKIFDKLNTEEELKQQLIPYFISSHPACTESDMAELAVIFKDLNFFPEQIQDFTPTPMTLATEIYYTGLHPDTLQPVYTAKTPEEKLNQRKYFFWYNKEYKARIIQSLNRLKRPDLLKKLYPSKK